MATYESSPGRATPGPRRGYADGPFGQVHFQQLGIGAPLVLLHQALDHSGEERPHDGLERRGRFVGADADHARLEPEQRAAADNARLRAT